MKIPAPDMPPAAPSSLVVVASANPSAWHRIKEALGDRFGVSYAVDLGGTLDVVQRHRPGLVVLCGALLDADVERARTELQRVVPRIHLIVIGPPPRTAPGAMERHLEEQQIPSALLSEVQRILSCRRARPEPDAICRHAAYREMVLGDSPEVQRVMELAGRLAPVDVNVLIHGESGTGKELMARWIHCASPRADAPFETVDLPSIPDHLFESILFGHERGSFTGAVAHSEGKFQRADSGTLFLDEVSSLKLELQPKLLRAIQEREVEQVGGKRPVACDVRIVAATNQDLSAAVRRGEFRADLFYRLNTVPLSLVPLRQRKGDIPALVTHFVERYAERFNRPVPGVAAAAWDALQVHDWPGNIRELENRVQRALLLCRNDRLETADFLEPGEPAAPGPAFEFDSCDLSLATVERAYIDRVMQHTGGNQTRAANILQISRKTLRNKLQASPEAESMLRVS